MPVYAQFSNSQGVRGPPSAVRAVLPELQAEQATHASLPANPSNTAGGSSWDPKPQPPYSPWEGEADSLKEVTLGMNRTCLIYFISVE